MLLERKRDVVLRPDDAEARYRLGEALMVEGDLEAASAQLEKAVALAPGHLVARRMLARAYVAQQRLTLAENTLREATRDQPDDAEARFELAELFQRIERPDDALLQLDLALRLDAGRGDRIVGAAELALSRGLLRKAREWYRLARRLDPHDATARQRCQELDAALGETVPARRGLRERGAEWLLDRAREELDDRALGLRQSAPWQSILRELRRGDPAAIKRALVTAEPAVKESPLYHVLRGEVLLAAGDLRGAEAAYRKVEPSGVSSPQVGIAHRMGWRRRSEVALEEGRNEEARALAERALAHLPTSESSSEPGSVTARDEEAMELLGDALAALDRRADALAAYARAARHHPSGSAAAKGHSLRAAAAGAAPGVGRIHALAWTAIGGAVSAVEAVALPGSGQLVLTGNVERIGREAAQVAFSCVRALAPRLGLPRDTAATDVHLHFTDHQHVKDGPSAGLALALAVLSALRGQPLRQGLAATGELSLGGAVAPVGGLHEKLVSAYLEGVRQVLVPRGNLLALYDLPEEIGRTVTVIPVGTLEESLPHAFDGQLPFARPAARGE